MGVKERFLSYVAYDTTADPNSDTIPSSAKQKLLGAYLVKELQDIGIDNAFMDEYGYVYGYLEANVDNAVTIGLMAHMDTSDAVSGANIKPRVIENYDGKDIWLNDEVVTTVARFPQLSDYINKTLIVTDGNTLLGADDKAGIAAIMESLSYFTSNPEVKHGKVCVLFNPDEEVGRGTVKFNKAYFDCDFAFTVDGGKPEEIEFENFNAASAQVIIKGISTHPGSAKNKMINAINVAMEFHQLLPSIARPEHTEGYEGFNHLMNIEGDCELTKLNYIIRNHDESLFIKQKEMFIDCAAFINKRYLNDTVTLNISDSYRNMRKAFDDKMYIVELAEKAISAVGLTPKRLAIRGGTDGAELTYKGILCPNIGAGGQNFHGRNEFCCVEDMVLSVSIINNIICMASSLKKSDL